MLSVPVRSKTRGWKLLRSFQVSTDGFRAVNWVTLRAEGQEAEKINSSLGKLVPKHA